MRTSDLFDGKPVSSKKNPLVLKHMARRVLSCNGTGFHSITAGEFMHPMLTKLILTFLVAFLSQSWSIAGSNIIVTLRNGDQVRGELMAVRESTLIVTTDVGATDEYLMCHPDVILMVFRKDIQELTVCGKSHLWDGVAIGLAGGIGIGMLVSYSPKGTGEYGSNIDPYGGGPRMLGLCAALGIGLGALGGGTGSAVTDDKKINVESKKEWKSLGKMARYAGDEPDYIRRK